MKLFTSFTIPSFSTVTETVQPRLCWTKYGFPGQQRGEVRVVVPHGVRVATSPYHWLWAGGEVVQKSHRLSTERVIEQVINLLVLQILEKIVEVVFWDKCNNASSCNRGCAHSTGSGPSVHA